MVWNARTRSLEVALQLRGTDLEAALRNGGAQVTDLDAGTAVDESIRAYIDGAFTVRSPAGDPVACRYAGKSVKPRRVWLYFDFPLATSEPFGA
ncbi:MAG: DUF6702 family protein, partial [Planctomycetota bacterium]